MIVRWIRALWILFCALVFCLIADVCVGGLLGALAGTATVLLTLVFFGETRNGLTPALVVGGLWVVFAMSYRIVRALSAVRGRNRAARLAKHLSSLFCLLCLSCGGNTEEYAEPFDGECTVPFRGTMCSFTCADCDTQADCENAAGTAVDECLFEQKYPDGYP